MTTPSEAAKKWAEKQAASIALTEDWRPFCTEIIALGFDAGVAHARAEWEGEKEKVLRYVRAAETVMYEDNIGGSEDAYTALPSWAKV